LIPLERPRTSPRERRLQCGGAALTLAVVVAAATLVASVPGLPPPAPVPARQAPPVVAEHHYRMAAKVRPLLLFWLGRDNVGGGKLVWRRGADDARAVELLIGSDPARAPWKVNRWGYINEEWKGNQASVLGLMSRAEEKSIEEATKVVRSKSKESHQFKLGRSILNGRDCSATIQLNAFDADFTYRDVSPLLRSFEGEVQQTRQKAQQFPLDPKPGLLSTVFEMVDDTVAGFGRDGTRGLSGKRRVSYSFNCQLYDVELRSSRLLENETIDGRRYPRLIESEFVVIKRATEKQEHFSLFYGIEGPMSGIPVKMEYQPRWWLKAELVLDEQGMH
jgi:hypothetical protein